MGSLFRVLSKELFSLGTLFFVIVPFVMSMSDDYSARQHLSSLKDQTQFAVETTFNGSKDNFGFAQNSLSSGLTSSKGHYVNGGPIYFPQQ